jgi:hypothetical protein
MDERDGYEDLCGSNCRSVISYVYRIIGLYCSMLSCLREPKPCLSFRPTSFCTYLSTDPCEVMSTRAFYNSRSDSYNESRGPTGDPRASQILCYMTQWLGVANDVLHDVNSMQSSCLIVLLH